jgi:hypothetical protein
MRKELININLAEKILNFAIKKYTSYDSLEKVNKKNLKDIFSYQVKECKFIFRTWNSLGGTFGNCWSDQLCPIEASDTQPFYYEDFLNIFADDLTVRQYKYLVSLIEKKKEREHDYYGGTEYFKVIEVELNKLSDALEDFNLIPYGEKVIYQEYFEKKKSEYEEIFLN